jgi:hypothetical protein
VQQELHPIQKKPRVIRDMEHEAESSRLERGRREDNFWTGAATRSQRSRHSSSPSTQPPSVTVPAAIKPEGGARA